MCRLVIIPKLRFFVTLDVLVPPRRRLFEAPRLTDLPQGSSAVSLTCGLGLDRPIGLYSRILEYLDLDLESTRLDLLTFSPVFFWSGFPTSLSFFFVVLF